MAHRTHGCRAWCVKFLGFLSVGVCLQDRQEPHEIMCTCLILAYYMTRCLLKYGTCWPPSHERHPSLDRHPYETNRLVEDTGLGLRDERSSLNLKP